MVHLLVGAFECNALAYLYGADEELGSVRVGPRVGHAQNPLASVLNCIPLQQQ